LFLALPFLVGTVGIVLVAHVYLVIRLEFGTPWLVELIVPMALGWIAGSVVFKAIQRRTRPMLDAFDFG